MWNLKTWQVCSSDVHVKRSTFWMLRNLMFYMFGCTYLGICRSFGWVGLWGLGRFFLIIFFVGSQIPRWFRWFPSLDHTRGPWNHGKKFTSTQKPTPTDGGGGTLRGLWYWHPNSHPIWHPNSAGGSRYASVQATWSHCAVHIFIWDAPAGSGLPLQIYNSSLKKAWYFMTSFCNPSFAEANVAARSGNFPCF